MSRSPPPHATTTAAPGAPVLTPQPQGVIMIAAQSAQSAPTTTTTTTKSRSSGFFGHRRAQSHGSSAATAGHAAANAGVTAALMAALAANAATMPLAPSAAAAAVTNVVTPTVQTHEQIAAMETTIAELQDKLKAAEEQLAVSRHDNIVLGEKLIDAREKQAEIQHSNELLTQEMNELTEKLFQEANILVSNESRRRFQAETVRDRMEEQLQQAQLLLQNENEQVRELRAMLEAMSVNSGAGASTEQIEALGTDSLPQPLTQEHIPQPEPKLYAEFVHFVQQLLVSKTIKMTTLSFVRRCIDEDVEPTVLWMKKVTSKKLVDACLENRCFLETVSENDRSAETVVTSPSSSGSLPLPDLARDNVCCACDQPMESLPFRYRLDENSGWRPIDQHCRDRLAAIGELFAFLRHLRLGLYQKHGSLELYFECARLRRQLLYVRLGLPMLQLQNHRSTSQADSKLRYASAFLQPTNTIEALLQKPTSLLPHFPQREVALLATAPVGPPPPVRTVSVPTFKFSLKRRSTGAVTVSAPPPVSPPQTPEPPLGSPRGRSSYDGRRSLEETPVEA